MSPELQEQISQVKKKEWVDLQGLVNCATTHFTASELPGHHCTSISLLGRGSYNTIYKLEFSGGTQLAASVSNLNDEDFNPEAKRSEIGTMKFVRESGLYPDIPVPKVFAWDTTFTNPVCAPYVLMELVSGRSLAHDLNDLSRAQQLSYIKVLARLQASLSKPVRFDQIGSIIGGEGKCVVGSLMTLTQSCFGGPYKSMEDLWRAQLEKRILYALEEWCSLETDFLNSDHFSSQCTPQLFAELFQFLSSLIPHFQPPKSYLPLVLHHPDIALRNILFDESSISSGDLKITALIDWGGAQILPLMFTAKYPDDLRTTGEYPFDKPGWDWNEDWYTAPCDWTSTGDPSQWPLTLRGGKPLDWTPYVREVVSKFYLRTYFNTCYAEHLHALHTDADLARATLFRDATYYMKFHEVVCGGWKDWVHHRTWIRETYWRLRIAGHGAKGSEELIIGPNIYQESIEEPVRDLGISGEYPVVIEYTTDPETLEIVPKGRFH